MTLDPPILGASSTLRVPFGILARIRATANARDGTWTAVGIQVTLTSARLRQVRIPAQSPEAAPKPLCCQPRSEPMPDFDADSWLVASAKNRDRNFVQALVTIDTFFECQIAGNNGYATPP